MSDINGTIFSLRATKLPVGEEIGVTWSDKRGISDRTDVSKFFSKTRTLNAKSTGTSSGWIPNHQENYRLPASVYNVRGMIMTEMHLHRRRQQQSHLIHWSVIIIWSQFGKSSSYHFQPTIIPTNSLPVYCV